MPNAFVWKGYTFLFVLCGGCGYVRRLLLRCLLVKNAAIGPQTTPRTAQMLDRARWLCVPAACSPPALVRPALKHRAHRPRTTNCPLLRRDRRRIFGN